MIIIVSVRYKPWLQLSPMNPAAQEQPIGSGPQNNCFRQFPPSFELQINDPWAPHPLFPKPKLKSIAQGALVSIVKSHSFCFHQLLADILLYGDVTFFFYILLPIYVSRVSH